MPEAGQLLEDLQASTGLGFRRLNGAIGTILDEWNMLSFLPLDYSEEDSLQDVLAQIDNAIQYGEDADVKIRDYGMGEVGAMDDE
jgi:hypothetical protein